MKFTTYESAVNPTVGNTPALRANGAGGVHVINTNPTAGQGLGGLAAGIGQMTKVAQKMQDDQDTADYMAARAQASQAVLDGLYGPDGMFSTRMGVNAKGLTADTVKLIRDSYADIAKDKNGRVQRLLFGSMNDSIGNYQRVAANKEHAEYENVAKASYESSISNNITIAAQDPADTETIGRTLAENRALAVAECRRKGLDGSATEAELRRVTSAGVSAVAQGFIQNGDTTGLDSFLESHKKEIDPGVYYQLHGQVKKQQDSDFIITQGNSIYEQCKNPDGSIDVNKMKSLLTSVTKKVHHGGQSNAAVVYQGFKAAGYSDEAIAGIMGRVQQEHNFSTEMAEEYDAPGIGRVGGFGMFQWQMDPNYGGRGIDMKNWAASNGLDPNSAQTQVQYAIKEAMDYGLTPEALNGKSAEEVADIWTRDWERGKPGSERQYAGEWRQKIASGDFGGDGGYDEQVPLSLQEQAQLENYIRHRGSQGAADYNAAQSRLTKDTLNAAVTCGDYATACLYIDNTSLDPATKIKLKNDGALKAKFGITSSRGGGGGGGGRGRKVEGGSYAMTETQEKQAISAGKKIIALGSMNGGTKSAVYTYLMDQGYEQEDFDKIWPKLQWYYHQVSGDDAPEDYGYLNGDGEIEGE